MTPIPILLYHSVGRTTASAYRRWCIDPELFAEHVDALVAQGYDWLTVSGLVDAVEAGALPPRPLVVTFDDGRADFVEHAVPVLARHAVPSTMYVVSGHVGATSSWLGIDGEDDQPMMSWPELGAVVEAGHEVGAHSRTHPELDLLDEDRATAEIAGSRRELEDGLGNAVRSFAYPHGYHSRRTVAATVAAGFDSACAVADRWSWPDEHRFALSRLVVGGDTTTDELLDRLDRPPVRPRPEDRKSVV